jgi:penicillin-binding protein 1A
VQAKRQPGSGFKAFIYSAALEAGFTAASIINDAPVVIADNTLEASWRPENYSGKFYGPTRLRYALTKSRNLVSIRLLRTIGVDFALRYAERFGFDAKELPRNLSLALGSGAIAPIQMARGYAVLANGGYLVEPYFIDRIEDSSEEVVFQSNPPRVCETCGLTAPPVILDTDDADKPGEGVKIQAAVETRISAPIELTQEADGATGEGAAPRVTPRVAPRVITPENHYLMNSMMRDVIQRGTATKARALGRKDLAGKTGTTNEQRDAWFNGFNRSLVAIAWVGFDSSQPLGKGEVGGKAALPAWIAYMQTALQGIEEKPLVMPEGMVSVRIDPKSGKLAEFGQENAIFETFRSDQVPEEIAINTTVVTPLPGEETDPNATPVTGDGDLF